MGIATAVSHLTAMFLAMFCTALMCGSAFMMTAMTLIAMVGGIHFMLRTMFCTTCMRYRIYILLTMLGASLIFYTRVISAMFGAVMFSQSLVLAMLDTGFSLFTFMLSTMLDAIVLGNCHLLMFIAMLCLHSRHGCFTFWRSNFGCRSRCRNSCGLARCIDYWTSSLATGE